MGARSRPRAEVCVHHVCIMLLCVCVYVYTRVYAPMYVLARPRLSWAELGLGWMRGNHGRLWVGSLVSRRDYRRVLKLIVTEVTSGQRQRPERE